MGLHIYSGSLVRFYTNDWENEIQRLARENGMEYRTDYPFGKPKWPNKVHAVEHLEWMRSTLAESLGPLSWNDDLEEYHTIKLHHEGREAVTMVAAYLHRPDLVMPATMPANIEGDPAYAEAGAKGYLVGPIAAFEAGLVLPGDFDRLRFIESPMQEQVLICSTAFLRSALTFVAKRYWNGEVHPSDWAQRGLAYARSGGTKGPDGTWTAEAEPADSFRGNAEFAFGVYTSMLEFSERHNTAIAVW
jgi:hypothetical protein